jgi:hypothetical protein
VSRLEPSPRSRRAFARVALLTFLFLGACFLRAKPGEVVEPRPDPIPVQIRNENFLDMNIYAYVGGSSRRLGTVTGNSTASFSIPWQFSSGQSITIVATPIGGSGQASSGALSVSTGQMIDFRIAPLLRQSSASIREPNV